LILDVDTGTDDAVALMCAALHPRLDLAGVGTVSGNVPVDTATAAAKVVLRAGFRDLLIVALDATSQAQVTTAECDRLDGLGTPAATTAAALIRHRIAARVAAATAKDGADRRAPPVEGAAREAAPVHDALCVAALVQPRVLERVGRYYVDIEPSGRTVLDPHRPPNASVALGANRQLFVDFLLDTLARTDD
jgi:inosine-uridine nucleoside N-ribohydrolase